MRRHVTYGTDDVCYYVICTRLSTWQEIYLDSTFALSLVFAQQFASAWRDELVVVACTAVRAQQSPARAAPSPRPPGTLTAETVVGTLDLRSRAVLDAGTVRRAATSRRLTLANLVAFLLILAAKKWIATPGSAPGAVLSCAVAAHILGYWWPVLMSVFLRAPIMEMSGSFDSILPLSAALQIVWMQVRMDAQHERWADVPYDVAMCSAYFLGIFADAWDVERWIRAAVEIGVIVIITSLYVMYQFRIGVCDLPMYHETSCSYLYCTSASDVSLSNFATLAFFIANGVHRLYPYGRDRGEFGILKFRMRLRGASDADVTYVDHCEGPSAIVVDDCCRGAIGVVVDDN
eukprot:gene12816-67106_t